MTDHDLTRGALLVDLALAGRVAHEDYSVVDATPTGFSPADALLQPIAVEPERELDWWMDHAAVGLDDLVRDHLRSGRRHRRWTPLGRRYTPAEDVSRTPGLRTDDPPTAAPAAIGDSSGITDNRPGEPAEGLLEGTGAIRWLCQAVVEHLQEAHRRMLRQAGGRRRHRITAPLISRGCAAGP